jgi:competence protein ComEC
MDNIFKVVSALYANTYPSVNAAGPTGKKNNTILMGSFVKLLDDKVGQWQKIYAFGTEGWIDENQLSNTSGFKCFFVDVGQGDGALIEIGNEQQGMKILIDGGPSDNLARYLNHYQYKYYFNNSKKVRIDYIFISHFDKDHYQGLIDIINDPHYEFGTIYHNGIGKFDIDKKPFPAEYNTTLGATTNEQGIRYLKTHFNDVEDLNSLQAAGGMQNLLEKFLLAVNSAFTQGRLEHFKRIDYTTEDLSYVINDVPFTIKILGPVTSQISSGLAYKYFDDPAHTVNGHSLVLKLIYGNRSFLFGGDLNIPAEDHLLKHYQDENPFEVDVAKSCHHGASEFTTDYMAKVNPLATVISSGDNESYSHPRADAIGCAGKYSRSNRPLVFSTELARSSNVETDEVLYGMINLRCDGERIIMAQMKESHSKGNVWDLYEEELNP